jgi:hypothetical protein
MGKVDGLLVGLATLSAAFYIYGLWDKPFIAFSSNILFPVYALISAIFGFDVARRYGLRSLLGAVFFFLALGLFIWCIGEIVWAIYVLAFSIEVPFPSLADVFYITGYGSFFIGFFIFMKVFRYVFSERAIIVPSIVSGLLILAITSFTVVPEAFAQSSNIVEAVLAVAYPMHDAALIALAVIALMVFWGGKLAKGWLYLLTGFMLTGLVDIFYYYYDLLGLIWEGHPLELLWLFSYLAMAKGFHDVWIGRE